jgi:DNA-binding PadR family transcriptional regulator
MLDKIILGFLQVKDLTAYDIKKAMENSVNYFYSSSFGSINPALKKLEKMNMVTCTEIVEKQSHEKVLQHYKRRQKELF